MSRSGRPATARTASSTPGMKLVRSVVTWRSVSVCATSPRITSWSATSPGSRTEWIGTSPSISAAVRAAVPDGASSLAGWWYSMISARCMWRDASAAKRIISTAPIAKFGATNALALARLGAAARSASTSKPVVPITTWRPAASTARALSSAASGRVKSTTTSQPSSTAASVDAERGVGATGELEVVGALDRGAHRLAHAPGGARDGDRGSCGDGLRGRADRLDGGAERRPATGRCRRPRAARAPTARRRARAGRPSSTASKRAMISSASSSGRPYSVAPPRRFMRAAEDSIASTTRALTFSRARPSSSSVAGCSRSRSSSRADDLHRLARGCPAACRRRGRSGPCR